MAMWYYILLLLCSEKFRNENRKSLSQISVKNDVLSAVFSSEQGLLKVSSFMCVTSIDLLIYFI